MSIFILPINKIKESNLGHVFNYFRCIDLYMLNKYDALIAWNNDEIQ